MFLLLYRGGTFHSSHVAHVPVLQLSCKIRFTEKKEFLLLDLLTKVLSKEAVAQ